MSKNILTSDKLIASIRRRAMIPNDTATFEDTDLLEIANEEIDVEILPNLLSLNEEFLVTHVDITLVNGQSRYEIPYRAVANKLREVVLVSGANLYEVTRIDLEHLSDYSGWNLNSGNNAIYIENNEIVFASISNVAQYTALRVYYYRSPSRLVETDRVGQITNINKTTGRITLNYFPENYSNEPKMDFVSANVPNKIYNFDVTPTSVNKNTKDVFFDLADIPDSLQVGDYLCESQETVIPQIPSEMHPMLAQSVAVHVLEALGDQEGLAAARNRLDKMSKSVMGMTENRVEGAPRKIVARHNTLMNALSGNLRRTRRI